MTVAGAAPRRERTLLAPRLGAAAVLVVAALTTCRDQPTGPSGGAMGYLAIRPVVSSPVEVAAFGLVIDSLRVAAIRPVADTLADTTVFFDPNASTLQLALPVLLRTPVETLLVHIELRAGSRVLFAATGTGIARAGPPDTSATVALPLTYVGPGAGVTHLQIAPRDSVVTLGLTQRFRISADSAGVPVDSFYVSWSTSDALSAPINGLGLLQAPGARGAVFVRAVTPNGVRDSTRVTFVPAPSAVTAVAGGGQTQAVVTRLVQPLRVRVTAADLLGVKGAPVRFRALTGGGSVRDSVVVTDSAGFAEDSVTLGSLAGTQSFTATVTGLPAVTFTASALAGPISAAASVVSVSSATVASGAAVALTLQAKDAFGNGLSTGGATVAFTVGGGTSTGIIAPSPATDNGDGTYTATFTGSVAGTATTIGATIDGAPVTTTLPTLTVTAGAISAATSTVTVSSASVASGAAATLTLHAKDAAGNALATGGATVVFSATGGTSTGTIGPTTDNGDGTYTAGFTGAVAGTATTIGATIDGSSVTTTLPTLTVTAGAISAATSIVTVSSPTVASGATVTLTLQAKDAAGNAITTGGATVGFTASGGTSTGTIGPTADHGDGTYTAGFTGAVAGTATTIGATVNGTSVTTTLPVLSVTAGAISAATSIITVSVPSLASGATATLTLQARDAAGNALASGGATVVFNATGGTSTGLIAPSPATDNGDGTYSATFTGGVAGTATTIGATVNSVAVSSALPTITVTVGAVSAATSVVSTSSGTVTAGASATLMVEARDAAGNPLTSGGAVILFTVTGGTSTGAVGPTTDHGDGTYTATFTGVLAGTATTIGATIDGVPTTSTASLTVVPGNSVGAQSIVTVSAGTVASGNAVTLTLQARDSLGNDITIGGSTVVFSHSGGTSTGTIAPSPATDNGDGTYTATFTGVLAGTATTIGATIDAAPVTSTLPTVTVTPGAASTATSLVSVSTANVAFGATATLTLQAKDAAGNNLKTGAATVVFTTSGGTSTGAVGTTTDHGDGTYSAIFTAATAGTATTIGATIDGSAVTSTLPTITVTAGAISAATSVVTVSSATVASGATVNLTLQAKDAAGNALATGGATVVFTDSGGTSTGTIAPATATDNGDGTYSATFAGVLAGTATTIGATINGTPVSTPRPTITVAPGAISTATSLVTVSDSVVPNAGTDTLRLQARDAAGNALTNGGATVGFTQGGGTSVGSIGATTDLGNGTYRAIFTATAVGTPTTIGATIGGNAVTSAPLPTIRVFATSTTHSSDVTVNETWTAAQSPHIVTGYLRVRNGATLTIESGALVRFDAGAGLQVGDTALGESGGLVLDGSGAGITLTANSASPIPGFWRGIELQRSLAVTPWRRTLIEWAGGTRPPAGTVSAEACLLFVNNSGAALVADSLHIRQCNHAGIHHFGGDVTVRRSEIDSATGSGIHEDFKATLELDTSRVVGSGQEGLLVASAVARLRSMAGNIVLNNAVAGIHMYGHQLRGFKQQDSIAGNGFGPGGTGDSIVVDSGLVDGGGVGFTLHHQSAPYLFTGPIKIINAPVTLSRGFTAAFAPGAGFQLGDSTPGNDAQLIALGTVDSQVVLHNRPGTPGWPGVFLGRQTGSPALHHVRIVGGGYNPAASVTANLLVDAAGGAGPMAIDSLTSDSSRGHGIVILSAPASGFRVRDDSIRNSAGIGLLIGARGTAADTISGNVLSGNGYPLSLAAGALPGLGANAVGTNVRDTLLITGGRLTANATLPYVPGSVWRALGTTTVDSGAILTIAARDTVAFDTSAGIVVGAQAPAALAADGAGGMILFTASAPLPWGWEGIEWRLMSGSGSTTSNAFRYVDVDRAGYSVPCYGDCNAYQFGALRFTDSLTPTNVNLPVDHIIVRRSNSYALDFRRGGTGTVNIQSSQFYDNLPDPMIRTLSGHGSQLTIGSSDLYHYRAQAIQGIYKSADPADSVTATNNWWGDVAGVDTGFNFQDSLGRTSIVFGAVRAVPFAATAFFPVGAAAGIVTTQDSVLSPSPTISTADSIRVRVVDASGRGVPGQSVNWSVQPPTGSSVTPVSGSGDQGGRVDALWSFTTTAGGFVATATGAGTARYYADVQPDLTVTGPNWVMQPALTQGTVPGAKLVTFTSTNRRGVLVSNSVDQYGNATHVASICFADPGGVCQYFYGTVDSTHSGTSAGDTIFFHTSVTQPSSYVLRGVYNLATGGQRSDSILISMMPGVAGVRIDRDQYTSNVQTTPDTAVFNSLCPGGQPNFYCQVEYHAFVVDSGLAPIGNQSARFQWTLVPAAGSPVSVATRGTPANDSALVTALANGFVRLAVTDTSGNNFGTDTMPVLVQQLPSYIYVSPDTVSVLVGATTTFAATVVDAAGDTMSGVPVHWRPDNTVNPHLTIVDTSVAGQVTVRLDSTPFGGEYVDALAERAPGDTAYGYGELLNPVWIQRTVGLEPWAIAANPQTHAVYVGHQGGQLYRVDGTGEKALDSVSAGAFVAAVAVNPVTDRVYVATDQGLVVLTGALGTVTTVGTGTTQRGVTNQQGLTVDSINNRIYLTADIGSAAARPVLRQVDGVGNSVVTAADVDLPALGTGAVFNPADGFVYVAIPDSDLVVAVDPVSHTIAARIPVGTTPQSLALNPVTQKIYVVDAGSEEVSVIAATTQTVVATIPFYYSLGGITVDAVHNRVYVGVSNQPYALLVDGATDTWQTVLPTGNPSFFDEVLGLSYDAANGKVFTANYSSSSVTILKY
jgi:YVTN family beta-propeller protein